MDKLLNGQTLPRRSRGLGIYLPLGIYVPYRVLIGRVRVRGRDMKAPQGPRRVEPRVARRVRTQPVNIGDEEGLEALPNRGVGNARLWSPVFRA